MNKTIALTGTLILSLSYAGIASASGYAPCDTNYGGGYGYGAGQPCSSGNLIVTKTVQNLQTGAFVKNLGINDPRYGAGQAVNFQITVQNNGNAPMNGIEVTDKLPQYTICANGSTGCSNDHKTISLRIDALGVNESRVLNLSAVVDPANQIPGNPTCIVNQVTANAQGQNASDNAQFCIQKEAQVVETKGGLRVFPPPHVSITPTTGPESLTLLGLIPGALVGLKLRKKALKK